MSERGPKDPNATAYKIVQIATGEVDSLENEEQLIHYQDFPSISQNIAKTCYPKAMLPVGNREDP